MTFDARLYENLLSMGINTRLAREAASRYSVAQAEAAVNWIFGDGATWRPDAQSEMLPSYDSIDSFETIEQVSPRPASHALSTFSALGPGSTSRTSPPPPNSFYNPPQTDFQPPPRHPHSQQHQRTFASNNPFNRNVNRPLPHAPASTGPSSSSPLPPKSSSKSPSEPFSVATDEDDEDEQLRRAIAMSQEDSAGPFGEVGQHEGDRDVRERSVRASAPPPSPRYGAHGVGEDSEGSVIGPFFGPSDKNDIEGKLAMVPASVSVNKEEEDFNRAIQESMMTASFHSVSALNEDRPAKLPRRPGAPLVYCVSTKPMYAGNFLQALVAVPQLRQVFTEVVGPLLESENYDGAGRRSDDLQALQGIHEIFLKQDKVEEDYLDVDTDVGRVVNAWKLWDSTLPPVHAITKEWLDQLSTALLDLPYSISSGPSYSVAAQDFLTDRSKFLHTYLHQSPAAPMLPTTGRTFVLFQRETEVSTDVHSALSTALWAPDSPANSLQSLADVVFVVIEKRPGVTVPAWKLDDTVVLDRYLHQNITWATQIRAQQAVAQGEVRRLREQANRLKMHKGQDISSVFDSLIKYLNESPSSDSIQAETRSELVNEIKRITSTIKTRLAELEDQIKEKESEANGVLFDEGSPERRQHVYKLHSICWHDGFTTPGKHLYVYIRNEEGWWRIQDHEIEKVEWERIKNDNTGQFTDGGPYLLIYSREGARPPSPPGDTEIKAFPNEKIEESVVFEEVNKADDGKQLMDVDAVQAKPMAEKPDLLLSKVDLQVVKETVGQIEDNLIDLNDNDKGDDDDMSS